MFRWRRIHGPQAAGKLPCATTLSSLDAAVVTRRRRRETSFAFPSGGVANGHVLYNSDALCDDGGPGAKYADCTYGSDCACHGVVGASVGAGASAGAGG